MKKVLFTLILLCAIQAHSQCIDGVCRREGASITASMIVDNSFRYYQPSGFAGIGVHAGVWAGSLGATIGYVESKANEKTAARRELAFTLQTKIMFLEERIQAVPFLAVGSNNYQDIGLRIGYKVYANTYIGIVGSYQMKYGLSVAVSTGRRN